MISISEDLYSVFLADLSEAERERVRHYADNFGIEPTDAVWALMIVLGRYSDLYEAVPGKINVTVQGILEKIQSVAAAEAESSRVRLQASLTDAVIGAAESVAARKGRRELVLARVRSRACSWLQCRGRGASCGIMGALRGWFAGIRALESRRPGAFERLRPARLEIGIRRLLPQGRRREAVWLARSVRPGASQMQCNMLGKVNGSIWNYLHVLNQMPTRSLQCALKRSCS